MKFSLNGTKGAAEAGKRLTAGIHNAKFISVDRDTVEKKETGETFDVMTLKLDVEGYGEYSQNFFIPSRDEDEERTQGVYGENPSRAEHFFIAVRQILAALDPEIVACIDEDRPIMVGEDEVKLGGSLTQFMTALKKITKPHAGKEVEVKFLPQSNGFVSINTFCARITRQGNVGIQSTFIGHNLVISASEQKKIDNAQRATPTNMASASKGSDMLAGLKSDLDAEESSSDPADDLPF